jgi:two-component system, OmpR family, response regulator RegX3
MTGAAPQLPSEVVAPAFPPGAPTGTLPACAGTPVRPGRRTVLLVEDEESITVPLQEALAREGFDASVARTASEALDLARDLDPDVVLLDVMLPDGSGLDVCRELRRDSRVPIIMVTARGEEADRIVGLELGADDYVTKPFSARELVARIRAVLRRSEPEAASAGDPDALVVGELRVDAARRLASFAGRPLELSRKEFDVLALLARESGRVVTREHLLRDVWDTSWYGSTKTLDVHVSGLRRKLGDDPAAPRYLHTVRGVGFRLAAPEDGP